MPLTTSLFLAFVYAAGIALGALLSILLWTDRRGNRVANRWLAASTGALAALTFGSLLEDTHLVVQVPHLGHVTDWLIAVVGPCIWLYVRRLTGRTSPSAWSLLPHFAPALLLLGWLGTFYVLDADTKRSVLAAELTGPRDSPNLILLLVGLQILAYWLASMIRLFRYRRNLQNEYSSTERIAFQWLRLMLAIGFVVWIIWILGQVLGIASAHVPNALAVPLALYVLAFFGLRQPAVFATAGRPSSSGSAPPAPASEPATADDPAVEDLVPAPVETMPAKYERSALEPARAAQYLTQLAAVMDSEKPWLENDLTLAGLAVRVGISPHHLSQTINAELGRTFFDYVNERRVREVQRCLCDPAYAEQSILDIALASGFNSKTAFNAAFKAYTGQTPSQFRAAVVSKQP
jgi:AraC-like DNA-binding protein